MCSIMGAGFPQTREDAAIFFNAWKKFGIWRIMKYNGPSQIWIREGSLAGYKCLKKKFLFASLATMQLLESYIQHWAAVGGY